jgi:hypothetical protein
VIICLSWHDDRVHGFARCESNPFPLHSQLAQLPTVLSTCIRSHVSHVLPCARWCGVEKMLEEFHNNHTTGDKHTGQCKACRKQYDKEHLAKKEPVLEPTVLIKQCRCESVI